MCNSFKTIFCKQIKRRVVQRGMHEEFIFWMMMTIKMKMNG